MAAALGGAALVITAVVEATGWRWLWTLALGLLVLSVPGVRLLIGLVWVGIYPRIAARTQAAKVQRE